jgi:flagellar FliL protein
VKTAHVVDSAATEPISFVALDPLIISLSSDGGRTHLRFSAQLEVAPEFATEVEMVKPRIVDVLNSYLRAVKIEELDDPTSLMKLRSQMLRRVQIVTGEGRIKDLLIMEFVLN